MKRGKGDVLNEEGKEGENILGRIESGKVAGSTSDQRQGDQSHAPSHTPQRTFADCQHSVTRLRKRG